LKSATPEDLLDEAGTGTDAASPRHKDVYDTQPAKILQRGQSFFESIYGKISRRIMGQLERSGTPDLGLLARLTYGYVLSNTDVLTPAETSFVLIASLIPQDVSRISIRLLGCMHVNFLYWYPDFKVNPQLKGHLRGALNGGASEDEVRAVRDIVIKICEASGMKKLEENAIGGWGWRSEVANV
jgi:hypothetical protein